MSKQYIYACIRIPMEVLTDGNYEPCPEYAKITFERCDELPTIGPLDNNNLKAVLSSFVSYNEPPAIREPEILIPKHLLKQNTRNTTTYNTTFKQRRGKVNRYSIKNRKTINLILEGDLLNSQTSVQVESTPNGQL
jgi:hypothetical protein